LFLLLGCPFVSNDYAASIGDKDGDGFAGTAFGGRDCNDADPAIHPDADEVWTDDVDHDCDGNANDQDGDGTPFDEDCNDLDPDISDERAWFEDGDGDGFGGAEVMGDCEAGPGHVAQAGDCDDTRADVNPAAPERCDPNDDDEDCDGSADDADVDGQAPLGRLDWYVDADGDGFGVGDPEARCDPLVLGSLDGGDCDDTSADSFPGAVWYVDRDEDGFGDPASAIADCIEIEGRILEGGDCDDTDPLRHPGAVDIPFDLIDADCAEDSDFDADGDGLPDPMPTWLPDWPIDAAPCHDPVAELHVGVGEPYATIQAALDDAWSCDTIVVHDGAYDDFQVIGDVANPKSGVVIAAAPGASPRIVAGPGLEATATVLAAGVILSGLAIEGGPVGVYAGNTTVLDRMTISDTLYAVESTGENLLISGSHIERANVGVTASGNSLRVVGTTFTDINGIGGVVSAVDEDLLPLDPDTEQLEVYLDAVHFERCSGGLLPTLYVIAESLTMRNVSWNEPGSSAVLALVESFDGTDLRVESGVSFTDHLIRIQDVFPETSSQAVLQDVFVRGHVWLPVLFPAFVAVDDFDDIEIGNVVLRGNVAAAGDDALSAPVWLRAWSYDGLRDLTRDLHNIEVSTGAELGEDGSGVGIMAQAGTLRQVTVVGMDAALWPLAGHNAGTGPFQLDGPDISDAIAWENDTLYVNAGFLFTPFAAPTFDRIVSDAACTSCLVEDPLFLRYNGEMPANTWDLRLRRDSPYYRYDQSIDDSSTCAATGTGSTAVEHQLGAFGNRAGRADPDVRPYDDCDGDGMYDTWEWELLALFPDLDDDGDLLTNLEEFELGTFPHLADSDSDTVPDSVDTAPFDPTN